MVTDDANGGTAAQQHEVRTRTPRGHALSVGLLLSRGHRRTSGRLRARRSQPSLRQHERGVVWVFAVCARSGESDVLAEPLGRDVDGGLDRHVSSLLVVLRMGDSHAALI
mgnify:CR=1 FL=1